ncbi:DUF134 domain-containing protein [Desulfovibrio sp. 86]|uniref:Uncharacterized protein n=1 Tax=uncultured Desulfovibrio sp. TaxID=167968 RepID=A0A212L4M0_9BACT|nr:DUF134 domain-containing protein [Desulfovibrio sp. 86]SCM72490.1 conserved hypothetical protein [uncultured Desulfovibrio sp.]VZH33552.1 conserved protein of unknown function [Desulfovibrio sp. 86]
MPQSTCFGPMAGPDGGPAPDAPPSGRGMRPGGGPGSGRGGHGGHGGGPGSGHGMHGMHAEAVVMTVDQYETVRLIDLEGFTQEACAEKMEIARTTVQSIYAEARKKLADALVNGKMLRIEGGEYKLCEGSDQPCGHEGCHHRRRF